MNEPGNNQWWYPESNYGESTSESWDNALILAQDLVSCGYDTMAFEERHTSPFPNNDYKYYVNYAITSDNSQIQIGNNYFSTIPH